MADSLGPRVRGPGVPGPGVPGPGVLRWLAALLIRGPEAGVILAELDDAMEREIARGIPLRSTGRIPVIVRRPFRSKAVELSARSREPAFGVGLRRRGRTRGVPRRRVPRNSIR